MSLFAALGCQTKTMTSPTEANARASKEKNNDAKMPAFSARDWYGVYATPEENAALNGEILVLAESHMADNNGAYQLKIWRDHSISFAGEENIDIDVQSGDYVTDGNRLYISQASGRIANGKVTSLHSRVTRYHRLNINQETVLLTDDALALHQKGRSLEERAGILIKMKIELDKQDEFDFDSLQGLPSLKLLHR